MPTTIDKPTTYGDRCDRLSICTGELTALIETSDSEDRNLTKEESEAYGLLGTEIKGLRTEIHDDELQENRRREVEGLNQDLDRTRMMPGRDNPETPETPDVNEGLRAARNGTYSLRYFKPVDNSRNARQDANQLAYTAGMMFLARCGSGAVSEWAHHKCQTAGIDIDKLAPFMGESGNTDGGYLVFPEFEATLIDLKEQYGVYQRDAFRIPMASDSLTIPRRSGGTTVYYPDEQGEITRSSMTFDNVKLIPQKYAQLVRWSTELNEDSVIAMADMLVSEMAYQFTLAEDTNGFIGEGGANHGRTIGILYKLINAVNGITPTASVHTALSGNTTVADLDLVDWEAAVGILPVYAEPRAKWYMSKTVFFGGPARLMDAAGGNTSAFLASGAPPRFLGYDVIYTQVMPTNSNVTGSDANAVVSIPAILGDLALTGYMGMRRGVTVKTSEHRFIELDQLVITATQRIAINNVVGDSVAPTADAGPMIALQCAAS